jgi:hypothetical protein
MSGAFVPRPTNEIYFLLLPNKDSMEIDKLYVNLSKQHKRAVNKLIRTLAGGKVESADFASICRSINRNTLKGVRLKKSPSAYIFFSQERFPVHKATDPEAPLGEIAKRIGQEWNKLPPSKKAVYTSRADKARLAAARAEVQ